MKTSIVSFLFIACSLATMAQSSYSGGLLTEVKPALSFQNGWKLNTKFAARAYFFEEPNKDPLAKKVKLERTELELVLTKKFSSSTSFGGGYLIRHQKGVIKQRLIQQFSVSNDYQTLNLGHRFRFDETFQSGKETLYRFRYRISLEKPLNWKSGKMSFILNNEYIPSVQNKMYGMEMRLFPGLRYKMNENNNFEIGLDYRVESLFTKVHKQIYLLYISWIPNFNLAPKRDNL